MLGVRGASSVHGCQYEGLHLRTPCSEEAAARSVAHIFLITAAIVECRYLEVWVNGNSAREPDGRPFLIRRMLN